MKDILKNLQDYQPQHGEGEEKVFGQQAIVGDQLTVERIVNGIKQVMNGFTPEQRFEGIHAEIADFHTSMKLLQVFIFL